MRQDSQEVPQTASALLEDDVADQVTDPRAHSEPIRFFLPGPSYVTRYVREAMLQPMVAHRSPAFRQVHDRLAKRLPPVFGTRRDVPLATGSATLVMELAVVSTVQQDVLNLVCGAFSERWHAISRAAGKNADRLEVPWGTAIDPDLVRRALQRKHYDAVTVVHCETSTGVLNPIEEIARVIHDESDALVLVDAVSSAGGVPVEVDSWGLDLVATGSQKALAAPPGIVPFAVSERTEERAKEVGRRGFFTDVVRYLDYHRNGGPITTPALPVAYALDRQMEVVETEGLSARFDRHRQLARRTAEWVEASDCSFASQAGFRSPTVSCIRPPVGVDAQELVKAMTERGFTVGPGYGQFKTTTFRIGHMGEVRMRDLDDLLEALDQAIGEAIG